MGSGLGQDHRDGEPLNMTDEGDKDRVLLLVKVTTGWQGWRGGSRERQQELFPSKVQRP